MTYRLTATVTHKTFGFPITKEIYFTGNTFDDVLDRIKETGTHDSHIHNLKHHMRTAFKDDKGVKHSWKLEKLDHLS